MRATALGAGPVSCGSRRRGRTDYFAKVLAAYLIALPALILLFVAGATLGVRLDAAQWFEMTGLLLIGLTPFILMGLILGHLVATDALLPAMAGLVVLFALAFLPRLDQRCI